jgi:hypothetical protein
MAEDAFDTSERSNPVCLGCDQHKEEPGLVVCWKCFKRPDNPFKYFQGSLSEWLVAIGRAN